MDGRTGYALSSEKCGFSMMPKTLPDGSRTEATRILSPTSWTPPRSPASSSSGERGGVHAPVGDHAGAGAGGVAFVRLQPELEAADVEPDVERLVEVRLFPQHLAVPSLCPLDVVNLVDNSPQALKHALLLFQENL
jgi:hypothetical protein